jgi:hypothetical protein
LSPSQLIASLNALSFGDVDLLKSKLAGAEETCRELGRDDLAQLLAEARDGLAAGDLKLYRKRVETVVSKLGHLR